MRVLVTGAFGNVSSHTLPQLLGRGHQVRTLNHLSTGARKAAQKSTVEALWGDVTNPDAMGRAVTGVDAVIHLAAPIPPGADERPDEARATNVDGTATVIAAYRAQPEPPRLLLTSTFDVHGYTLDKPPPRHVDDPLVPGQRVWAVVAGEHDDRRRGAVELMWGSARVFEREGGRGISDRRHLSSDRARRRGRPPAARRARRRDRAWARRARHAGGRPCR